MNSDQVKGPDPQRVGVFLAAVLAWKDEQDRKAEEQARTKTRAFSATPAPQAGVTAEAAA